MIDQDLDPEEIRKAAQLKEERDAAKVGMGGTPKFLFEKELEPFTPERMAAATNMGLKYGFVTDKDTLSVEAVDDETKEVTKIDLYKQFYADSIIVGWLCSVDRKEARRALSKPDDALDKAFEWADKNNIRLSSPEWAELSKVFLEIMTEITRAAHNHSEEKK